VEEKKRKESPYELATRSGPSNPSKNTPGKDEIVSEVPRGQKKSRCADEAQGRTHNIKGNTD